MKQKISRRFRSLIWGTGAAALILFAGASFGGVAIHTVTQNGDSGPGSFRQAIADSAPGDVVNFAVTGTITLGSDALLVNKDLIISGPGARNLNIAGPGTLLEIDSGNVTISGLTVGPGNWGVFFAGGSLTMNDCAVSGNHNGGGIYANTSTALTMNGCTISNNKLDNQGGAGLQNNGAATLTNCTIAGNQVLQPPMGIPGGAGGGLYNNVGTSILRSCTVTGNSAFLGGGGIVAGPGCQLINTIVGGNTGQSAPDVSGAFTSNGHNLIAIKDGSTGFTNNVNNDIVGTGAAPRDPLLLPLQNNGGQTDTAAIFAAISPAVNAALHFSAPDRDQRGFLRPNTADIGACEFQGIQPVTLANISSRAVVQTGDNVLIGGFIITGNQLKSVLLRAIGPSLALPGKLQDPVLELYQGGNLLIANDDWQDASNAGEIANTGAAPTNILESAILSALAPGAYTFIVKGFNSATGIGVVEAYDLNRTVGSRLANISTRAAVQTGDNVLIGGFIVLGPDSLTVVVRGIGTSLNVPNHLADPFLELHDGNGATLATNDNWRIPNEAGVIATGVPPTNDAESAIVMTLAPGNYTAIVRGVNSTTGVAVVEVYGVL